MKYGIYLYDTSAYIPGVDQLRQQVRVGGGRGGRGGCGGDVSGGGSRGGGCGCGGGRAACLARTHLLRTRSPAPHLPLARQRQL